VADAMIQAGDSTGKWPSL